MLIAGLVAEAHDPIIVAADHDADAPNQYASLSDAELGKRLLSAAAKGRSTRSASSSTPAPTRRHATPIAVRRCCWP